MASRSLGTLTVDLIAKIGGFKEGLSQSERELAKHKKKVAKEIDELVSFYGKGATAVAAALSAVATAVGVIAIKTAEAVDEQSKLAASLATTNASLTTLRLAGDEAGLSLEDMNKSAGLLNDAISEMARGGKGGAADALRALGFSAGQLAAMNADERVGAIVDRIKETVPAAQQAAVSVDIFGKAAGQAMLAVDGEALASAADKARVFGVALNEIEVQRIKQIADFMDTVKLSADGLGNGIALAFAPLFNEMAKGITGAATAMEGFQLAGIAVRSVLVNIVAVAADIVDIIWRPFKLLAATIESTFTVIITTVANMYKEIVAGINKIPGVNIDAHEAAARDFAERMVKQTEAATGRVGEVFTGRLWGNQLRDWVSQVDAASMSAASVAAQNVEAVRAEKKGGLLGATNAATGKPETAEDRAKAYDQLSTDVVDAAYAHDQEMKAAKLADEQQYWDDMDRILEDAWIVQKARIDEKVAYEEWAKNAQGQILGNLSTLMNSHSRKAFEIGKIAAIAQAVVNTAGAATRALLEGGPFLGPALAASIVAAGMVQIQTIKRTQFNGGGGAGVTAGVSATQSINASSTPVNAPGSGSGRNVYVHGFDPSKFYSGQQMLDLINDAMRDGGTLRQGYV
jgi:hypothetical protein